MAYIIKTDGMYMDAGFEVKNYDDAINLVSMLVEYGKVGKKVKDEETEETDTIMVPMTVSMIRTDGETDYE